MTTLRLALPGLPPDYDPAKSQWMTPPDLARRIALWAGITRGDRVLEPSAGIGALALAARERGAEVTCVEMDRALVPTLEAHGLLVINKDFLETTVSSHHLALMNSPFEGGQTELHIVHALKFAPRVVCIAQLSLLAGQGRKSLLWDKHTLKRLVILSARPRFSGSKGTAERDFGIFEVTRGRENDTPLVGVTWW